MAAADPAVDLLMNCAGIQETLPFHLSKPSIWSRMLALNSFAPLSLTQTVGARLLGSDLPDCIVNIVAVAPCLEWPAPRSIP